MKSPDEWMRDFEGKIAAAQAKAAMVQDGLAGAASSASSDDGAITVAVAANGALTDVRLTPAAMGKSHTALSAELMAVARKAQRSAAAKVAEVFEAAHGPESETLRAITEYLPPEEEAPAAQERHRPGFIEEMQPPPQPPRARPRRPDPSVNSLDDGDFSDESAIFKK
ncbi:YbaB/EbfC DNA-binding family protein [Actinokineospora alba]|uniref:YbaB/EbfC DNA-binding family protein n=1 Tax=Actinokineospora alba TaxID=504798 RepID=A0A1H0SSL4_9PSEU|nr:YbaB/EbfC family nucleoid-associated protein [Actinokineospora alba]TDP66578.1 YbaB/EbfC DNA-binding family protein [Actinokineospora alba]SDJ38182.1 YbaB/EbfC DNA-binding family protein [Actinokineospora alba]SDP44236.1 YbaB/EbfC DNA-binding family protein [Actinokineospora alba]